MKKTSKEGAQLEQLLRKYDQQKELLAQQNRSLQDRIFRQIDDNHKTRIAFEQRESQLKSRVSELQSLLAKQQQGHQVRTTQFQQLQQQHHRILTSYRQALQALRQHQSHQQELTKACFQKDQLISKLQKANNDLSSRLSQQSEQYEKIKVQIYELQIHQKELSEERERLTEEVLGQSEQLKMYEESIEGLAGKYANSKKKRRELENELAEQARKSRQAVEEREADFQRLQHELAELISEKDRFSQKSLTLATKVQFLTLQLNQKDALLQTQQSQHQKTMATRQQKQADLTLRLSNLQAQHLNCQRELQQLQSQLHKSQDQLRQALLAHEFAFQGMKEKLLLEVVQSGLSEQQTEEIMRRLEKHTQALRHNAQKEGSLARMKEKHKALQQEVKYLKEERHKTQAGGKSAKNLGRVPAEAVERARIENQMSQYEIDISLIKKEFETVKHDKSILQSKLIETRQQLAQKTHQLATAQNQASKLEKFYVDEIKKCISELQSYKERDQEAAEQTKQEKQTKQVLVMKINGYERKIKELVDGLERKDALIQNFKAQRKQAEETITVLQEKINRNNEEAQALKRAKADVARKQELVQQYKLKYQTGKNDRESIRGQRDRLRRQNERLEKSLQRKASYLQAVKNKYEKQLSDIERKLKSNSNHTKSISNVMQQKLTQIKKQCSGYEQILQRVSAILWNQLKKEKEKKLPGSTNATKKKRTKRKVDLSGSETLDPSPIANAKNWEAAKVLGLKDSQIEEFLNPNLAKAEEEEEKLKQLWDHGDYEEYFERGLQYLIGMR